MKKLILIFIIPLILGGASCKSKPGQVCDEYPHRGQCYDDTRALFCLNGKYTLIKCVNGCSYRLIPKTLQDGFNRTYCNAAITLHEPCISNGNVRCSDDGKTIVKCVNHRWKKFLTCEGKKGCFNGSLAYVSCHTKKIAQGKSCKGSSAIITACSANNKKFLECNPHEPGNRDSVFKARNNCLKGCDFKWGEARCKGE